MVARLPGPNRQVGPGTIGQAIGVEASRLPVPARYNKQPVRLSGSAILGTADPGGQQQEGHVVLAGTGGGAYCK